MTFIAQTVLLLRKNVFIFVIVQEAEMSHVEKMSILRQKFFFFTKVVTKLARQAFSCLAFQEIENNSKSKGGDNIKYTFG